MKAKVQEKPTFSNELRKKLEDTVCFHCKRVGHLIYHCPFDQSREPKKVPSPNSYQTTDKKKHN